MQCSNKYASVIQMAIPVGARSSPLSRVQVKEVLQALQQYHPLVDFIVHFLSTTGDQDQSTSLRTLDKTDFFTKEIDLGILSGHFRLGIHSAKDLPAPLPKGLSLICLTKGVDAADVLVLRDGETLASLPSQACIATSSARREECVKLLRTDLSFCDLRGTIEQRLAKLERKEADGVVVAEAALIRLGLTHLNRIRLPGPTAEGQGQLAVVALEGDQEMRTLFACLDVRKNGS
ncbi:hydroxymethylbilane synthase [Candidatus Protochlamydia phocaeensis]|uniref:hydroxymethylbilane synthase n=1 Tax=Candidatus Protochlamydia phocaeensis TaxID=1414722 RepID=UPI0009ABDD6F|nr:hydroxymethylbilane synthase [Candidatus Protochlamydia phocaeensis]